MNGDKQAFLQLIISHRNPLYVKILPMVQNEMQAQQTLQQAFIKTYEKLSTYSSGSFKLWFLDHEFEHF
ncbi:hypothetical protein DCE79_01135 [Lysinibacillus sp. 2017]|nr:hypothetical protein DCE79_01135 [Lysinibacillus sp. 2017]